MYSHKLETINQKENLEVDIGKTMYVILVGLTLETCYICLSRSRLKINILSTTVKITKCN